MRPRFLTVCLATALCFFPRISSPQVAQSQSPALPQTMRFCAFYCFTLALNGDHYDAVRDDSLDGKPVSTYRVRRFSRESVVIMRSDVGGNVGTLTGNISSAGNSIENGRMTSTVNNETHSYPFQMTWGDALPFAITNFSTRGYDQAVLSAETGVRPPEVMHFCSFNCFTLKLRGNMYVTRDSPPFASQWKIEKFTARSVVIRRHDEPVSPGGAPFDVLITAQISADGNRLINIAANGAPVGGVMMDWGLALQQIPGSNAERDQRTKALGQQFSGGDAQTAVMALLVGALLFGGMDADTGPSDNPLRVDPPSHWECSDGLSGGCVKLSGSYKTEHLEGSGP